MDALGSRQSVWRRPAGGAWAESASRAADWRSCPRSSWIFLFGINPLTIIDAANQLAPQTGRRPRWLATGPHGSVVDTIVSSTSDVWKAEFGKMNRTYQPPRLVLYEQATGTQCGLGQAAMGPYCPRDNRVYLDLQFFNELSAVQARATSPKPMCCA
jgi:predicted metalloprotease